MWHHGKTKAECHSSSVCDMRHYPADLRLGLRHRSRPRSSPGTGRQDHHLFQSVHSVGVLTDVPGDQETAREPPCTGSPVLLPGRPIVSSSSLMPTWLSLLLICSAAATARSAAPFWETLFFMFFLFPLYFLLFTPFHSSFHRTPRLVRHIDY